MSGRIEIYNNFNNIYNTDHNLYNVVNEIFSFVLNAAETAYNRSALQETNPKQKNWASAIDEYIKDKKTSKQIYTLYGYAVEELVNIQLRSAAYNTRYGYRILLQVTYGYTRPDIVLRNSGDKDVAWLDITSEKSVGHIYNKDSTKWKAIPFVAELLYPALDKTRLRTGADDSIGACIRATTIFRQHIEFQDKLDTYFYSNFTNAINLIRSSSDNKPPSIAQMIEQTFNVTFPEHQKHAAIKSMLLKFREKYPYTDAGEFCNGLLSDYYKYSKQNKSAADDFILKSYNNSA